MMQMQRNLHFRRNYKEKSIMIAHFKLLYSIKYMYFCLKNLWKCSCEEIKCSSVVECFQCAVGRWIEPLMF